jgi:hypothetical protein
VLCKNGACKETVAVKRESQESRAKSCFLGTTCGGACRGLTIESKVTIESGIFSADTSDTIVSNNGIPNGNPKVGSWDSSRFFPFLILVHDESIIIMCPILPPLHLLETLSQQHYKRENIKGGHPKGHKPTRTHQHTTMQEECMDGWMMVGT